MQFNIISNLANGAGLERDYKLLRGLLEAAGHEVNGVQFNIPGLTPKADINIFLEIVRPQSLWSAKENWLIPNSEWWYADLWDKFLRRFSRILCKTRDAVRIWSKKVGTGKCSYIGFESLDFYNPAIPRQPTFLHVAGKSETKNTAVVMEAWRQYSLPPLTAIAWKPNIIPLCKNVPNVTHIQRVSEPELRRLMNANLFHIMPSKQEGFGHYLHEAIGCGNVVLTTDAPPMNEFNGIAHELLIKPSSMQPMRAATAHIVSPATIAESVNRAAGLSQERIAEISAAARSAFLADRDSFRAAFGALLA